MDPCQTNNSVHWDLVTFALKADRQNPRRRAPRPPIERDLFIICVFLSPLSFLSFSRWDSPLFCPVFPFSEKGERTAVRHIMNAPLFGTGCSRVLGFVQGQKCLTLTSTGPLYVVEKTSGKFWLRCSLVFGLI